MKTTDLVVQNIRGLLNAQGKHQGTLAFALGKDRSWVNKILNGRRGLDVSELNGIADFFHIEAYQLLQPGIAQRTERRSGTDRRNGRDRREAEAIKTMQELRERLKMASHGVNTSSGASPLGGDDRTDIQARFVARLKREISAAQDVLRDLARASEQIRQQVDEVSTARHPVTPALRRSRKNDRPPDSAADKE
jgi:transcriptional regulator with XRE-family HTH domain